MQTSGQTTETVRNDLTIPFFVHYVMFGRRGNTCLTFGISIVRTEQMAVMLLPGR